MQKKNLLCQTILIISKKAHKKGNMEDLVMWKILKGRKINCLQIALKEIMLWGKNQVKNINLKKHTVHAKTECVKITCKIKINSL